MPIGTPTKEAKAEIETHPVTTEAKTSDIQYNLKSYKTFCASYSSIYFYSFRQ